MSEIKIGDTINYISVELRIDGKLKTMFTEHKVLGMNDENFCLDDQNFSTLQFKSKSNYNAYSIINRAEAHETIWGIASMVDYTWGRIYTTHSKKVGFNKCKKAIEECINEKYGRYGEMHGRLALIVFPETELTTTKEGV